jgi:type I restriction enzyme S subunit
MSFIVDNFSVITQASSQVLALKNLILDLAIRGKLIAQIESDEPVSVLLRRVVEEKKQALEKSKKKGKQSNAVAPNKLFNIPSTWTWSLFGDISINIHYGFTEKANENLKDVRFLRITDIQNNQVNWTSVPGCIIDEKDISKYKLKKDDILIARTGGTIGKSYLVKDIPVKSVFASYLIRVIPTPSFNAQYIKLFLESPFYWNQLRSKTTGTGQPNVNATSLKALNIPVPPKEEQHRIVQKVNTLFQQIDQLAEASEQAENKRTALRKVLLHRLQEAPDQPTTQKAWLPLQEQFDLAIRTVEDVQALRQTILQLAVKGALVEQDPNDEPASVLLERIKEEKALLIKEGKIKKQKALPPISEEEVPFELPIGWKWCRLNDICEVITDGTHQTPKYTETGRMFISAKNVKPFKFMPEACKYVSEIDYQGYIKNRKPNYEDILLTRVGSNIGEAAKIDQEIDFAIYVSVALIKPFKVIIDPDYLVIWLNSPSGTEKSIRFTYGRGMSQGNLNLGLIRKFVISLPPINEQKRIVKKVEWLLKYCDKLEEKIIEGNRKNQILISTAFQAI